MGSGGWGVGLGCGILVVRFGVWVVGFGVRVWGVEFGVEGFGV